MSQEKSKSIMKRAIDIAGHIVAIAAVIFVILKFRSYSNEFSSSILTFKFIIWIAFLSVVYFLANILLVFAWKRLLQHLSVGVKSRVAFDIYGRSQLSKYIPGNIFQFAGRQILSLQYGLQAKPVIKSMAWELACLVFSGGIFALLLTPNFIPLIQPQFSIVLFIIICLILFYFIIRNNGIALAIFYQCVFLLISGAAFCGVLYGLHTGEMLPLALLIKIVLVYIVAWLAGLVTPGAPAGVGVREAVLIMLIPDLSSDIVLMTAVYGRIVTLLGDVLFYIFAQFFGKKCRNE